VARSTVESQPIETAMGASTVLPGVPLPAWNLPAEVLPEPEPVAEAAPVEEHAESSLDAALLVASMAAATAPVADPPAAAPADGPPAAAQAPGAPTPTSPIEDAVPIAAPPVQSIPAAPPAPPSDVAPSVPADAPGVVSIGGPAPTAAPVAAPSPATAPWDQPAPEAPFAPHDTLPEISAPPVDPAPTDHDWDAAAAALAATAGAATIAHVDESVPHRHGREATEPAAEPARRRFGLRRKAAADQPAPPDDATDPSGAPVDAPVAPPATTEAVVDLPAPVDAVVDLPAPVDAPVALPAPSDAPVDLAAPVGDPVAATADGYPVDVEPQSSDLDDEDRSRRPLVLLAAVGALAVVAAVAAFVWPGLLVSHDDAAAPTPVTSLPSASAPVAPVTLQTPDTAAGYQKLSGPPATALAQAASGTTLDGFTAPVTAVYGTAGVPKATVIAWAATSPTTPASITAAFAGFVNASGVAVTSIAPVATGNLGGSMRCGITSVKGTPATACFWADDASFGAVTVLSPATAAEGATTATAIRLTVETRG